MALGKGGRHGRFVIIAARSLAGLGRDRRWIQICRGMRGFLKMRAHGQPRRGLEDRTVQVRRREAQCLLSFERQPTRRIRGTAAVLTRRSRSAPGAI